MCLERSEQFEDSIKACLKRMELELKCKRTGEVANTLGDISKLAISIFCGYLPLIGLGKFGSNG